MKRGAFGYPRSVRNFDALLKRLKIDDNKTLLDEMTRINETERANSFAEHVSKLLREKANIKPEQMPKYCTIETILQNINAKEEIFGKIIQ